MIRSIFFSKGCEWGWNMAGDRRKTRVSGEWGGMGDRRMWDEIGKKRLLWLYYHSPILLLGFSYDAYMMLLSCSYVWGWARKKIVRCSFFLYICIFHT